MNKQAKITYILQLIVETAGAIYKAGAYDPVEEKFSIYVDRNLDSDLMSALNTVVKKLMNSSGASVEVIVE